MKIELSFKVFDNYLKIHISGGNPYPEIHEILMHIKRLAEENDRTRIFINAWDLSDVPDMEKFYIGEQGAKMFGNKIKFALLRKPEHINKFTENVVVNRGGRLFIVSDEQEALRWLLS
ncbi:MAG TPA: hypothetical protein VMU29_10580 [Smithella sp.]|nr:hypothetical protein [Smithella sp.]